MNLTVWRRFIMSRSSSDCEAYLRFHLGYSGEARLAQVCHRYMKATEHPACSLTLVDGRIRVDRPPAWTRGIDPWAATGRSADGSRSRGNGRPGWESPRNSRHPEEEVTGRARR